MVSAASRMDDLIGELLTHAVSRDGALQPSTIHVDRVAVEVAETLSRDAHVIVQGRILVHADPVLVRHLLTNLLGNSVKYATQGAAPRVSLGARRVGEMVEVRVSHHGIGIPAAERERVFDQFHRAHPDLPGTGLGLGICRTIVERHGGEIRAEAGEAGGTRMVFTLPAPPRAPAAPSPPSQTRVALQPGADSPAQAVRRR